MTLYKNNYKNKIQHSFNRAASSYDDHCHAQQRAGSKLIQLIKPLHAQAERVLDLGCGTGMTTQQLASQYDYQDFHAIDISWHYSPKLILSSCLGGKCINGFNLPDFPPL